MYVIVNRRARGLESEASRLLDQCRACATAPSCTLLETNSLEDLHEAAQRVAASPAPVVLAGGDGAHGAGITALTRAFAHTKTPLPSIALAPGGTVNTVAKGWGMRGDPVAYTRRLLLSVEAGTAARTRRPTLLIEHRKNDGLMSVPTLGFILGAGLVSRFFELYDAQGAPGLAVAATITARLFAGSFVGSALARQVLAPAPCELRIDGAAPLGEPFDKLSMLCASVVEDVGLGLRLLYRARESHSRFHVVATPLPPRELGPQMTRVLRALPLRGPRIDTLAESVSLRFPAGAGAYVIDGELVRSDHVVVRAGPVLEMLEA